MTDRIHLRGVEAIGRHGVLAEEKRDGQPFVVDVILDLDLAPAGASDDLTDTVSYADVAQRVVNRITGPSFDLIERLAEVVADDALARPLVEAVTVTVHKPQAPIAHPFSDVAVEISRRRGLPVVIALGANVGEAVSTLESSVQEIAALRGMRVRAVSPLVETDPVGGPEQPAYLNAVLLGETTRRPADLLDELHRIEARHGRERDIRWGPRTLDLDLIQVGMPGSPTEVRSDSAALTLPHPLAHQRGFVLVPWAQVDPEAVVRDGDHLMSVKDLAARADISGVRPGPAWSPTW
jgi:dihydroneopterin aldolase / 2-amino-4-hydroxy-6-hydroxymethyldihydropteridine diphosphokinase